MRSPRSAARWPLAAGRWPLAHSIESLIAFRLLQGLGAWAGGVIARAVVRDLFERDEAARIFSGLILVGGHHPCSPRWSAASC